jgi:hypothetical protein
MTARARGDPPTSKSVNVRRSHRNLPTQLAYPSLGKERNPAQRDIILHLPRAAPAIFLKLNLNNSPSSDPGRRGGATAGRARVRRAVPAWRMSTRWSGCWLREAANSG